MAFRFWDSNPSECSCPVDSCRHQFKNWRHPSGWPLKAIRQSSPISSTIQEKSELVPSRERVRISYFHQRYYILSLCPSGFALRRTGVWYIRRNTPVRYNHASAKGGMLMKRAEIPVVVSQKSGHAAGALLFTSQKNNIYCRKMSCANAIEMV